MPQETGKLRAVADGGERQPRWQRAVDHRNDAAVTGTAGIPRFVGADKLLANRRLKSVRCDHQIAAVKPRRFQKMAVMVASSCATPVHRMPV